MTGTNPWTHKNHPRNSKTKKLPASIHIPSLNNVHSNHILWTIHLRTYIFYFHHPHISWPLWLFMLHSTMHLPQPQPPSISDGGCFTYVYTSHHISCCTHTPSTLHHHHWRSHAFALILCNETRGWRNTIGEFVSTTTCAPQRQSGEGITTRHVLGGYVIHCLESKV